MMMLFLILVQILQAQNPVKYIYLNDPGYEYIDYLINSGDLNPDFIFQQPYEISPLLLGEDLGEVSPNQSTNQQFPSVTEPVEAQEGLGVSLKPYQYYTIYWKQFYSNKQVSTQLNLSDRVHYTNDFYNRYRGSVGFHLGSENVTLANRTVVDQNYKYDPLFAGDLSESKHWLYGRVEDAYINLRYHRLNMFFGRMHRNWGPINSKSLILSDNPYSYDHFLFSYTWDKIKLSLIFSQLENVDAILRNVNDTTFQEIPNSRKYLVGHRVDINLYDNFQIAFTEMAMYGGPDRDIELAFFNPMNFYYAIQRNDNQAISGIWNLDVFYKPIPRLTLYGQFLLDDIIVNNDPGINDRARFPDRLGITTSLRTGDLIHPGLNLELTYVRIWNRTYQSKVTFENYHYRKLGLGYPCASCEELKFKFGLWSFFPLFIQNETIIGRYGNVNLTDPFPLKKESFPVEPVTSNFVNITSLKYFFTFALNLYSNIYYFDDGNFYSNRIMNTSGFRIEIGANMLLSTGIVDLE